MIIKNSSRLKPGVPSEELAALLEGIGAEKLRGSVAYLAEPRHHFLNEAKNRAMADWLVSVLSKWGYRVSLEGEYRNVVALPQRACEEVILVGAHHDSVAQTPGADDNASAVAALLGCALLCSLWSAELPVIFVAFNCEEDGLLGSREFVAGYVRERGLKIRTTHILEMVGYADHREGSQIVPPGLPIKLPTRGDFLGLLANQKAARAMNEVLQTARTYAPNLPVVGLEVLFGLEKYFPVLQRSDHAPFWAEGMPAIMWTDTSEFRNPHYHASSDTADTLDYAFLQKVTQVLTACVISEADTLVD